MTQIARDGIVYDFGFRICKIRPLRTITFTKNFFDITRSNNCPNLIFGLCFSLLSRRFEKTTFSFFFKETWTGVIFGELWMVLLYFLITDGNSLSQSALLFSITCSFNKFLIVLISRSAFEGRFSINLE